MHLDDLRTLVTETSDLPGDVPVKYRTADGQIHTVTRASVSRDAGYHPAGGIAPAAVCLDEATHP